MQLTLLPPKPSCTACDLHSAAKNVGIPSRHLPSSLPPDPANPVVIVIGMNPGTQEDRAGECWIGPSGQLLSGPYLTGSGVDKLVPEIGQTLETVGDPVQFVFGLSARYTSNAVAIAMQVLLVTSLGDIVIRLSDSTPLHRDNFLKLVKTP